MTLTVEQAILRVPQWQGKGDIKISPLEGGITNRNYRVDVGAESFHLRLAGENTHMLGIDREHEYEAAKRAGELGIAPEVVHFIRPEGYLVTRFIPGRPVVPEELRQPDNIRRVVEALHRLHSLPHIPGVFNAFQVVRDYTAIAQRYDVKFPENFDWLISQMNDAESALNNQPPYPRPCHNDLLNANFLLGDKLYILDWEYAGMGDIFFDLANFSNNHELSTEEDRLLLNCYFNDVIARHVGHLNIMKIMSDFREAMWGQVQAGISDLDFDFRGYADKHFGRLTQNIQHSDWNQWLEELEVNDSSR
ncbi:MAG TPA: choline/ethanolamine kinase family protein [Anaerolineales bacterium]|nr:choline/ethanolamine kinase family protein [Anaerolineales bacterium]